MKNHALGARQALLDAFAELALTRRYQEFGTGLIAVRANVARSTFYYHFKAKDDLLIQNLMPMISALARLPFADEAPAELCDWTSHIWQNRANARRIFDGAAGKKLSSALSAQLVEILRALPVDPWPQDRAHLIAEQISGAAFGLLRAWIAGRSAATPADIVQMLSSTAKAIAATPAVHKFS